MNFLCLKCRLFFWPSLLVFCICSLLYNMAMAKNFEGKWESDFGILDLVQKAGNVTGGYSCCNGTISGKIVNSQLDFTWSDPIYGNGWGRFILSDDGNQLKGIWGYAGQENTNGTWNAKRFNHPSIRGVPTYWVVQGRNDFSGSLTGTAELFINGDQVTGQIKGSYTMDVSGRPEHLEIFNHVDGLVSDRSMQLKWRNPIDGTSGTMDLNRNQTQLNGVWASEDGKNSGTIIFKEIQDKLQSGDLTLVLERQTKRQQAEELLQIAVKSNSSDEAIAKYREAAKLFRELDDPNKTGYALYGQAAEELNQKHYDEAYRLYKEVLTLVEKGDSTILLLTKNGMRAIELVREKDPKAISQTQASVIIEEGGFQHSDNEATTDITPRMALKYKAFDLVLKGPEKCQEAFPMLEKALALYRLDRGEVRVHGWIKQGSLIDEINILTRLVYCHLMLGHDQDFIRSFAELIKVREEISRVPHLSRMANPAGGPFQQIASFFDTWRGQFKTDYDKKQASERVRKSLDEVVRFLADNGNPVEAFVLSENMRGRAFGDLIASKIDVMAAITSKKIDSFDIPSPRATAYLPLTDLLSIVSRGGGAVVEYHVLDDVMFIWVIRTQSPKDEQIRMIKVPVGQNVLQPLIRDMRNSFDATLVKEGLPTGKIQISDHKSRYFLSELYR